MNEIFFVRIAEYNFGSYRRKSFLYDFIGKMPFTRSGKRAEESDLKLFGFDIFRLEYATRLFGSHGMGTRRSASDFIKFFKRFHSRIPSSSARTSAAILQSSAHGRFLTYSAVLTDGSSLDNLMVPASNSLQIIEPFISLFLAARR